MLKSAPEEDTFKRRRKTYVIHQHSLFRTLEAPRVKFGFWVDHAHRYQPSDLTNRTKGSQNSWKLCCTASLKISNNNRAIVLPCCVCFWTTKFGLQLPHFWFTGDLRTFFVGGKSDPKAIIDTSLKRDYFYLSDFVKFGLSVQRRSKLNASSCMGVVLT